MTVPLEGGEWSAARPGRTLPPRKDLVPILQEAEWAPGPVWTGRKSRPHRYSIPDHQGGSQLLYRLSYQAHLDISEKRKISCPCQDLALESFSNQPTHIYYTICILCHNGATPLFTLYAFVVCMETTFHILPPLHLHHKDGRIIHYVQKYECYELYNNKKISVIPEHLHSCKLIVQAPSCLSKQ